MNVVRNSRAEPRTRTVLCIQDVLRHHAQHAPETLALVAPNRAPLTYAQLWARLLVAVGALRHSGVVSTDRVGVVMPDGPDMALALLSVSACATVVPITPLFVEAEYERYFTEMGVTRLLTSEDDASAAVKAALACRLPVLRPLPDDAPADGAFTIGTSPALSAPADISVDPTQVALVISTSGTTSRPKVIAISHDMLCAAAQSVAASVELGPSDRCLNVMTLCHTHGLVGGLLSSLSAGASVICPPGFDASRFFAWMQDLRPTWYTATPTIHQAVLTHADRHRDVIAQSPLRFVRSISAPLPDPVHRALEDQLHAPVIQAYALTEAAGVVCSNPPPPGIRKIGSVGPPFGVDVAVVDREGAPVRAYETGEIVIRGSRVIGAYDGRDSTPDPRFIDGWLRTGDAGHLDADGYLFITGRLKDEINRAGEKINPFEIDSVLLEHSSVAQACTFGVPHPTLGQDVAAAVVLRAGETATEQELRDLVGSRLAFFKVPSRILVVERLPVGVTGKVRRHALPELLEDELAAGRLDSEQPAARPSPLSDQVARIYAEVLGLASVEASDNFFDLGGDSVRAMQVIARVKAALRRRVPLLVLFDNPIVEHFAGAIEFLPEEAESLLEQPAATSIRSIRVPARVKGEPSR